MPLDAGGPYLSVAALCERVLTEGDGVLSAIRIVDRITHVASDPGAPEEMPPIPVSLTALVVLKSGAARGRHALKIRPEDPAGMRLPEISLPILFEGEDRGASVVVNLALQVQREGLYWFDVYLDEERITRMPMRVVYHRLTVGT